MEHFFTESALPRLPGRSLHFPSLDCVDFLRPFQSRFDAIASPVHLPLGPTVDARHAVSSTAIRRNKATTYPYAAAPIEQSVPSKKMVSKSTKVVNGN